MTTPKKASQKKSLLFARYVLLPLIGCICTTSCSLPENKYYSESEIMDIYQAGTQVDSLVRKQHPDPVAYLDSVTRAISNPGIVDLYRKYVGSAGYFAHHLKDYEMADAYADSALQLFEVNHPGPEFNTFYLYTILTKADILRSQHLYGTAIQYYLQGWQMIDLEAAPCLAGDYLGRMGSISYRQENYWDSIDFYTRSWEVSASCAAKKDFSWFQRTFQHFHNLASNYHFLQMPDSALHYNQKGADLLLNEVASGRFSDNANHVHFMEVAKGVVYGNLGTSHRELGHYEEAEYFWKESIQINQRAGYANEHAELTRLRLAEYYVDTGRLDEAEEQLATARSWLDGVSSEMGERRWWRVKWNWLDQMGDTDQAYTAHRHYAELQETDLQNKVDASGVDIATQIRLFEQQREIGMLQRQGELRDTYLYSAIIISLMAIIILVLLWRNWRQSQKNMQRLVEMNKTIVRQNRQLEKSNKAITRIVSIVAHDLRSPLGGIREISLLMLEDEKMNDEHQNWAQLIHRSSKQSLELVKEIVDFDAFRRDSVTISNEPVEMGTFLQQCVEVLRFLADEKNQFLNVAEPGRSDKEIICRIDPHKMARVVNNLVGNAIKFSPEGSEIKVQVKQVGKKVCISVQDHGIGIPDDLKESVFEMFTEARRQGTNGEGSFGLGLAISKKIVEAHNGKIWFESDGKSGTTFYTEFPLSEDQSAEKELKKNELNVI